MLLTKTVKIKWYSRTKSHYTNKGYKFTKMGDYFEVNVNDLTEGSHADVQVLCDYCKETVITKEYRIYLRDNKNGIINNDCCENCKGLKIIESNQKTYGVNGVMQLDEVKEKAERTCEENYGVKSPLQNKEILQKVKNTNLERYSVENVSSVDKFKEKREQTNLKRWGYKSSLLNPEIIKKFTSTNLNRYGVKYPMQNKEILKKCIDNSMKTLDKNGKIKCSTQQIYLSNLLNGKINYLFSNCFLDIVIPNKMVYIEYDGGGHDLSVKLGKLTQEEFNYKEIKRGTFLEKNGWKLIRIISSKDLLPSDEKIIEMIDYAKEYLSTGHNWIKFDIDNQLIKCSQFEESYDYGKLRRITKKDLELQEFKMDSFLIS